MQEAVPVVLVWLLLRARLRDSDLRTHRGVDFTQAGLVLARQHYLAVREVRGLLYRVG